MGYSCKGETFEEGDKIFLSRQVAIKYDRPYEKLLFTNIPSAEMEKAGTINIKLYFRLVPLILN